MVIEQRNLVLAEGEIDLIARDGAKRVAVEVRTITGPGDPIDAVDPGKRRRVATLAGRTGVARVDLIGIALRSWGIEIHWVPGGSW